MVKAESCAVVILYICMVKGYYTPFLAIVVLTWAAHATATAGSDAHTQMMPKKKSYSP